MSNLELPPSYGRIWRGGASSSAVGTKMDKSASRSSVGSDSKRADCAVHVTGLDDSITVEDLTALFASVGSITNVKLNKDFTTGQRRDDGYVYFADYLAADMAVRLFDNITVDGSLIHVSRSNMKRNKVVVVGSTITGLCAAVAAEKAGASVIVLEKDDNVSATKQMYSVTVNLIGTPVQEKQGINDSIKTYISDMKEAYTAENTRTLEILAREAASAGLWRFLTHDLGIDLVRVHPSPRCSVPRSHTATKQDLANELWLGLERYVLESDSIRVVGGVTVTQLLTDSGRVNGVQYTQQRPSGKVSTINLMADAVVMATGGFVGSDELLEKYCGKEVARLPRCIGELGTDLGIRLLGDIGALVVHMDQVLLHPTVFVSPTDPESKYKEIAPEVLRAHGGILVTRDGKRFTNELLRDEVTQAIRDKDMRHAFGGHSTLPCAYLVLNQAAAYPVEDIVKTIVEMGLMKEYNGIDALCQDTGIDLASLTTTFVEVSKVARGLAEDPFGRESMPTNFSPYDKLYVGCVTPALHYTMGGVVTNQYMQVTREQTMTHYPGLFAVGEVTASIMGINRITGNTVLEAIAFGRIAGELAANHQPAIPALSPKSFVPLRLGAAIPLSPSTKLFRFNLPTALHQTGLDMGQYIAMRKEINGEEIVRYYSPVSRADDLGHIDVVIKTCTGGDLTAYLDTMQPGDTIDFKGPISGLEMEVGSKKRIGMLAGGTGISPMLQLIRAHLLHEAKTGHEGIYDLSLIYAVKNEEEILLRSRLEHHKANHPHFRLYYVLAEPPEDWPMGKGFVTPDIIKEHMPPPTDDALVVVCGPPIFCKIMVQHLDALGYVRGRHYYSYM